MAPILNFNGNILNYNGYIMNNVSNSDLYTFTTFTFTNAGATGHTGPTLVQIRNSYSATSWTQDSNFLNMTTQGVQLWTVPATGTYRISAAGAGGGDNLGFGITGGSGAYIVTNVTLNKSDVIAIVVGQRGGNRTAIGSNPYYGAGGGGGTFVYDNTSITYYVAAGGGGGAASTRTNLLTSLSGTANSRWDVTSGATVLITNNYRASGGTNGGGGNISTRGSIYGGPGAGINSNGRTANNLQGKTRINGWLGGFSGGTGNLYAAPGGFGGGGGSGSGDAAASNFIWAGGGGGYSGGGAGGNGGTGDGQYGGAGGSYYIGTLVTGATGYNSGNGFVTITKL